MKKYIDIVKENNINIVCTNESRYITKKDRANYRLYRQIISGGERIFFDRDNNHMMTNRELEENLSEIYSKEDIEKGFKNAKLIKEKIEDIKEPTAEPLKDCSEELTKLCIEGWNRIRKGTDREQESKERYEYELSVINGRNFSEYFIKVLTIVKTAKKLGILMGPARGSGAGSEVCFLIGITHVDPLKYGLFFERFLNPERHGFPDIDVDMATVPLARDTQENRYLKSLIDNLKDQFDYTNKLIVTPIGSFHPNDLIQTKSHGKISAMELFKLTNSGVEVEV